MLRIEWNLNHTVLRKNNYLETVENGNVLFIQRSEIRSEFLLLLHVFSFIVMPTFTWLFSSHLVSQVVEATRQKCPNPVFAITVNGSEHISYEMFIYEHQKLGHCWNKIKKKEEKRANNCLKQQTTFFYFHSVCLSAPSLYA